MKRFTLTIAALLLVICGACTNMNKTGESTTTEGTTTDHRTNAEMENHRTATDVDTISSPGSNATSIKSGDYNSRDEQHDVPTENANEEKPVK